jgi:predicted DNA-binding ribbon-helix-helix protein
LIYLREEIFYKNLEEEIVPERRMSVAQFIATASSGPPVRAGQIKVSRETSFSFLTQSKQNFVCKAERRIVLDPLHLARCKVSNRCIPFLCRKKWRQSVNSIRLSCQFFFLMEEISINVKGHLANERTFLHWLSLCMILGALSISLLNFSKSLFISTLFASIATIFMFYALYQFKTRATKLNLDKNSVQSRGLFFEDINGTFCFLTVVFLALGANLVIKIV